MESIWSKLVLYILILNCFFLSCKENSIDQLKGKAEQKALVKIKDYLDINLLSPKVTDLKKEHTEYLEEGEYYPLFIGSAKSKTIKLEYDPTKVAISNSHTKKQFPSSENINITIDTSRIIGSKPVYWKVLKNEKSKIASYPVFIKNLSKDSLTVGYGHHIPIIKEARDSLGNWRKIERVFTYQCGTGLTNFALAPKSILLSSFKISAGDYKTKVRLVMSAKDKIYSNEIEERIYYTQFEKEKFNENK